MAIQTITISSKRVSPPIEIPSKNKKKEDSEPSYFHLVPNLYFAERMRDSHLGSKHVVADVFAHKRADKEYKALVNTHIEERTHDIVAEVFINASLDLVKIIVAYSLQAKKT